MWQNLLKMLSNEPEKSEITGDEAIATILVRAAKTDDTYTKSEQELIEKLLSKQMHFDTIQAGRLRIRGEILEKEINDDVQLTKIIKEDVPYENRQELIQQLWQIILDDDIRTPEENKLMRVLTHLLGVSDMQSAKARSKAVGLKEKKNEQV